MHPDLSVIISGTLAACVVEDQEYKRTMSLMIRVW